MIQFIKDNFFSFIKFGIVGVINTFTSWIVYYFLLFLGVHYLIGNTIGYLASSFIGFILNKTMVFKKKDKVPSSLFKYYVLYISSYCISMLGLYLLVDVLGISDKIAPMLMLFITVPYNYLGSKFWVFSQPKIHDFGVEDKDLHTFVICAYKESRYLEECVKSVINQSLKTNIIMTTSTPNQYIENIANKYNIKLYIREGKSDICDDWNFGYNLCKTNLVTVAHQDDVYEPDYAEKIVGEYKKYPDAIMLYTGYHTLKNDVKCFDRNNKIKRLLLIPMQSRFLSKFKFWKKLSLAFGNTITCPSVTYNKSIISDTVFTSNLKFALDWDTFFKFAKQKGRFIYIPKTLISYRVHSEATTNDFIVNNKRQADDIEMFNKIWPKFITKFIMIFYIKAYDTYKENK